MTLYPVNEWGSDVEGSMKDFDEWKNSGPIQEWYCYEHECFAEDAWNARQPEIDAELAIGPRRTMEPWSSVRLIPSISIRRIRPLWQ